jgi:hypothetical protein
MKGKNEKNETNENNKTEFFYEKATFPRPLGIILL